MTVLYQSDFDAASIGAVMMEVRRLVDTNAPDPRRLMIMVRELADNALYHSGEGRGWCAVARSGDHLEVVVRDRGQGIHRSLHHLYSGIDERQAVRRVFRGQMSATAEPNRWPGVKSVLDFTQSGVTLLLETGGLAVVGVGGRARLVGKSTQRVDGVVATLRVRWQVNGPPPLVEIGRSP